jgi:hypothetical protein
MKKQPPHVILEQVRKSVNGLRYTCDGFTYDVIESVIEDVLRIVDDKISENLPYGFILCKCGGALMPNTTCGECEVINNNKFKKTK